MQLDVIIPTYNRCRMLRRTLDSLLAADVPAGLEVRVTVVDNNSKDATRETVESYCERFGYRLGYVFEGRQGRSFALNAGIRSTVGDLVGMIDDDEEIDRRWYSTVYSIFSRGGVDFIGGPYVPRWGAEPPAWLPTKYLGAIGWVDGGDCLVPFDANYPGILMGGNAVIARATLNRVGLYNTNLGRTDKRLISGEDDDMYQRLIEAGARGFYVPELIIYHHIPPERLTRSYFRRWCFWRGVSCAVIDRKRQQPVVYFGSIPRYLYGQAARGLIKAIAGRIIRRGASEIFTHELSVWDAVGFFYGKMFYQRAGSSRRNAPSRQSASTLVEPDVQQTCSRLVE
ncbi:MAG TPA: glycosyltransferase [Blastocatellia bacterium]|nr:glycosyltransferase [Blastocatellia bacterium]